MRKFGSFVAKKFRSERSYGPPQSRRELYSSASASASPGSFYPPIVFISSLAGIAGYIINDLANRVKARKIFRKLEEENDYVHNAFKESEAEFEKLSQEKFGTK